MSRFYLMKWVLIASFPESKTLIVRKSRMPQIQGVEGKGVGNYCEPLTKQEMGCHRLSQRVNKIKKFLQNYITSIEEV